MAHPVLLSIGWGNVFMTERIVAIVAPDSAPMKRLQEEVKSEGKLIQATQGCRREALMVTDSHHVILLAMAAPTMSQSVMAHV